MSNTLDTELCIAALEDALDRFGTPEIFNTDQGCQFTNDAFTYVLKNAGVRISMDGRGRWLDNIMIDRLWRSLKCECIYLQAFATGSEVRQSLKKWYELYTTRRPHSSLDDRTPHEAYWRKSLPGFAGRSLAMAV